MRGSNLVRRAFLLVLVGSLMVTAVGLWPEPAPLRVGLGRSVADSCPPVAVTPYFTDAYGTVQLDGTDAPVGTIVEAVSPRGDVVGCRQLSSPGILGATHVFGEDTSIIPTIPGMRDGEEVIFRVNGVEATASPLLIWHDDRDVHEVTLDAVSPPKPISDLMAEPLISHLVLTWSPVTENTAGQPITDVSYRIYRAENDSYFLPSGPPFDIALNPTFVDWNALADPGVNYFYIVTAVDGAGLESAPSSRAGSYHLTLGLGWNLVSWPLAPYTTILADILNPLGGACDEAWAYDTWDDTDPWKHWTGDLVDADETVGLWLHLIEPAILPIIGRQSVSTTIDLRSGWNLVGYPSQMARPVIEVLASIDGFYNRVQTFDPTHPAEPWKQYDVNLPIYANDLALMEPGQGYWVSTSADCAWTVEP